MHALLHDQTPTALTNAMEDTLEAIRIAEAKGRYRKAWDFRGAYRSTYFESIFIYFIYFESYMYKQYKFESGRQVGRQAGRQVGVR